MVRGSSSPANEIDVRPRFFPRLGPLVLFAAVSVLLVWASLFAYGAAIYGQQGIGGGVLAFAVVVFVIGSLKSFQLRIRASKDRGSLARRGRMP